MLLQRRVEEGCSRRAVLNFSTWMFIHGGVSAPLDGAKSGNLCETVSELQEPNWREWEKCCLDKLSNGLFDEFWEVSFPAQNLRRGGRAWHIS